MTDIVERLRKEALDWSGLDCEYDALFAEAADEIERLREKDTPTPPDRQSHYCLECSKRWFGEVAPCTDEHCPFAAPRPYPKSEAQP